MWNFFCVSYANVEIYHSLHMPSGFNQYDRGLWKVQWREGERGFNLQYLCTVANTTLLYSTTMTSSQRISTI